MSSACKLLCFAVSLSLILSGCGADGMAVKELDAEEAYNIDGELFYRDSSGHVKDSSGETLYTIDAEADIVQNGSDLYTVGESGIGAINIATGEIRSCYTVIGTSVTEGSVRINGRTDDGLLFYVDSGIGELRYFLYSFDQCTASEAFTTSDRSLRFLTYSGSAAYFTDDGGDILAMDTSTGAAKTLVQNAGSPTSCAAAEGWLYYVLDNTLFRVSTGGGEPDKLTDGVSAFCIDGGKMYAAFCDYDAAESETGKCHLAYASAPYTKFKEISGTSAERATIGTVIKIGDTIYVL